MRGRHRMPTMQAPVASAAAVTSEKEQGNRESHIIKQAERLFSLLEAVGCELGGLDMRPKCPE